MRGAKLERKLEADEPVFGPFVMLPAPGLVEIAGLAAFDFVLLDMEHGPHGIETIEHMVRAADAVDLPTIVRVPENSAGHITRALDTGASGVCVPHVSTAAAAEMAVRAAKFAPAGERGVNAASRAARYARLDAEEYFRRANEEVMLVGQIEDREAVENLAEILEVEGMDVVFIGPYDLSQSYGKLGQVEDPELQELMRGAVRQCRAVGLAVGTFESEPEAIAVWMQEGVRLFTVGTDVNLFGDACREKVSNIQKAIEGRA
ncbi:MAG: HpcH/HpaI aldolase/citrate lyase family protein [Armatimonadota bacterium]